MRRQGDDKGITRIEGLVVFVPNTKPGDKVQIKVNNIGRRFAEAEVIGETEGKDETK